MSKQGKVLFIIHDLYQEDNSFPFGPAYMTAILRRKLGTKTVRLSMAAASLASGARRGAFSV